MFSSFYSDRCSHYWPLEADDKADKENLTPFWRATKQLTIDMIAAYSPEAGEQLNRCANGALALFRGPSGLAHFTPHGRPITDPLQEAA